MKIKTSALTGILSLAFALVVTTAVAQPPRPNPYAQPKHNKAQMRDRMENKFDRKEDVRDRREDKFDRREDKRDVMHQGGKRDRIEDRFDRKH
jgi:hypothetical protein